MFHVLFPYNLKGRLTLGVVVIDVGGGVFHVIVVWMVLGLQVQCCEARIGKSPFRHLGKAGECDFKCAQNFDCSCSHGLV